MGEAFNRERWIQAVILRLPTSQRGLWIQRNEAEGIVDAILALPQPEGRRCECCESTDPWYVHPEEGIDLCGPCVAAMPRSPAPVPQEDVADDQPRENVIVKHFGGEPGSWNPCVPQENVTDEMVEYVYSNLCSLAYVERADVRRVLVAALPREPGSSK